VDDPQHEASPAGIPHYTDTRAPEHQRPTARDFSDKITYAFQLATAQGPLCNEPIQGIAVFVEDVAVSTTGREELGRLTGEVIRSVRDAVWQGFLDWSPRILLAMYRCEIQASSKYNNSSTTPKSS
jgi:ribosome assembly protein 1